MQKRILDTKDVFQESANWQAKYQKNRCARRKNRGRLLLGDWAGVAGDSSSATL